MKIRHHLLSIVTAGVVLSAVSLRAVEDSYCSGMTEKASRGLVNVATGWFELPMQIKKGYDEGVPCVAAPAGTRSLGALTGVFRGAAHSVGRTVWGAAELATFWAVNPTTNRDVLLLQDGNYVWEEGAKKPFRCPCAADGAKRVGMRFERGLNDTVGCFLEVPGQIKKADKTGAWWPGIPKGLYCMVSRFTTGVTDMALVLLPSPEENLMVPYDEVYPWDAWEERYYSNID